MERVPHELRPGREAELLHHMRAVRLGRPDGDEEQFGDLLIRVSEREQAQHLALAIRERIGLSPCARVRLGRGEPRAERRMDVPAAARNLPYGLDELVVGGLLEEVAGRA